MGVVLLGGGARVHVTLFRTSEQCHIRATGYLKIRQNVC